MRKDLEDWLRGKVAPAFDAAADLQLPVNDVLDEPKEPQAPGTSSSDVPEEIPEVHGEEAAPETETGLAGEVEEQIGKTEFAGEEISLENSQEFSDSELEAEKRTPEPDSEPEVNYHEDQEIRAKLAALEEASSRMAMRRKLIEESQRAEREREYMYERGGYRKNRARFFAICAVAVLVIGTLIAMYRNSQRTSYDAMMEKANELYGQQQYAAAFEAYNEASERYSDRVDPFLGAAHSAVRMGYAEEAIAAYRSSLERFPADAAHSKSNVYYEIGRLYAMLKAWERAQENFEAAISADAVNYGAYFSLGDSLEEQGQPDKALLAYRQALELSPSSDAAAEAVKRVSHILASVEEADKKASSEQKYVQAVNSGNAALKAKQYSEASKYFADALAISSADASAWTGFAEARDNLGDTAGAIKSFQRALERNPNYEPAKSGLAEAEARSKRNNSSQSGSGSPRRSSAEALPSDDRNRKDLFSDGVELYRKGEFEASFNSFLACLRSPERERVLPVSSASLINLPDGSSAVWKGPQASLNVPSEAKLLAEAVRLNPIDRDLYVNLSISGTKMGIDRKNLRSALHEARSHALRAASGR